MRNYRQQNSTRGFYVFADDATALGTGKTGLTITVTLSKSGGAANAVAPSISEIGGGFYWVTPLAAHRDTLGENLWQFAATGAVIAGRVEAIGLAAEQAVAFGANTVEPLSASGTRAAVGLASANLDSQIATLATPADVSPTIDFSPTIEPTPVTVNPTVLDIAERAAIATSVWGFEVSGEAAATRLGRLTAAVATLWTNLIAMITGSGASAAWTTKAVENVVVDGGVTVNVLPLNTTLQSRVSGSTIEVFANAATVVALGITDAAGDPVDLEELTLELVVESLRSRTDKLVIPDGELGRTGSTLNVLLPKSVTTQIGQKRWALWDKTAEDVLAHGLLIVNYAAKADA